MTNRTKGTLAGIGLSFIGIVLWILFAAAFEIIAGIAGGAMGLLFVYGYKKYNAEDKSAYLYVTASILMVLEIILAEIITIAIIAGRYHLPLSFVLEIKEMQNAMILDIIIGLALSFLSFLTYIYILNTKNSSSSKMDRVTTHNGLERISTSAPPLAEEQLPRDEQNNI